MKKLLLLQFKHETNVFCPAPADLQAFRNCCCCVGEEVFHSQRGLGTEMGQILAELEPREDLILIPTVALVATPSGPVTAEVYDFVTEELKRGIEENPNLDGILIVFHGAMVAEGHADGEGDMLELIRGLVGWELPIVASLDLHANVTEKMARCATALVPYEHYPHTDNGDTGRAAAKIMADTLDGKLKPVMAYRRIPYLLPLFPSADPAMVPLYDRTKVLQAREGARCVRFTHGFFPADIAEMGMSVLAITDGNRDLAETIADEMAAAIEAAVPTLKRNYPTLDEALDRALLPGDGPVVLADASDNTGAGALGDSTHILRRILERGITGAAVAVITDPVSVKACVQAGVGSTVELNLGGWSDPAYSGGPLQVSAYVRAITDGRHIYKGKISHGATAKYGTMAVLEISGNVVLVSSLPEQPLDLEVFRRNGIAPEDHRMLVTKSAVHYQASFGTIAREMIGLSLPGYAVPLPEAFAYKNWKETV